MQSCARKRPGLGAKAIEGDRRRSKAIEDDRRRSKAIEGDRRRHWCAGLGEGPLGRQGPREDRRAPAPPFLCGSTLQPPSSSRSRRHALSTRSHVNERPRGRHRPPSTTSPTAGMCRTQAPGPDRPPGGLPSGVWYTPAAAPLPARAGEEARGPLDSGSLPSPGSKPLSRDPSLSASGSELC